jgi:hypothetical protein
MPLTPSELIYKKVNLSKAKSLTTLQFQRSVDKTSDKTSPISKSLASTEFWLVDRAALKKTSTG